MNLCHKLPLTVHSRILFWTKTVYFLPNKDWKELWISGRDFILPFEAFVAHGEASFFFAIVQRKVKECSFPLELASLRGHSKQVFTRISIENLKACSRSNILNPQDGSEQLLWVCVFFWNGSSMQFLISQFEQVDFPQESSIYSYIMNEQFAWSVHPFSGCSLRNLFLQSATQSGSKILRKRNYCLTSTK